MLYVFSTLKILINLFLTLKKFTMLLRTYPKCTLRTVVGENCLDQLFYNRSQINNRITELVRNHAHEWGINNIVLEIKDVSIPSQLQRIMAKTDESKIIVAEGENKANEIMLQAAKAVKIILKQMELIWLTLSKVSALNNQTLSLF